MSSGGDEVVIGDLLRGDAAIGTDVAANVRDGANVSFRFRKGTIVVGEELKLLAPDRAIEFVVNSELPEQGDDATYDGRILKDNLIEPAP